MWRHVRVRVVAVEVRPNLGSSRNLFPYIATAKLACGHSRLIGAEPKGERYRPTAMACPRCSGAREVGR